MKINVAVLSFNCPTFAGKLQYDLRSDGPEVSTHIKATKMGDGFLDAEIPDKENPAYHSSLCETQQWFTALPDELRRAFPPSLATE